MGIAALLAIIGPMVPDIIKGVEQIFANKPKSGAEKMTTASGVVKQISDGLVKAGILTESPALDQIVNALEGALGVMKAKGDLGASASAESLPAGAVSLGTLAASRIVMYGVTQYPIQGTAA